MPSSIATPRTLSPSHQTGDNDAPRRHSLPRSRANTDGDGRSGAGEPKILFQHFFKSVGPRTYAAQVKEAQNGNHFVVLTESRRQKGDDEPRKTRLFVFSEDFVEFFKLLQTTAQFIKSNPVSEKVKQRQQKYWSRRDQPGNAKGRDYATRPTSQRVSRST